MANKKEENFQVLNQVAFGKSQFYCAFANHIEKLIFSKFEFNKCRAIQFDLFEYPKNNKAGTKIKCRPE